MLSKEQQACVDAVAVHKNNVIVDSVAGCGKTTTAIELCANAPGRTLIITFNKRLSDETIARVRARGIEDCDVKTYHALCHRYYADCPTDTELNAVVANNVPPKERVNYSVVVLDEQQDMYFGVFKFIKKFLREVPTTPPLLAVFGDERQAIYQFMEADARFITHADQILCDVNDRAWMRCSITETFRLTRNMVDFVNKNILQCDKMVSNKSSDFDFEFITINWFKWYEGYYNKRDLRNITLFCERIIVYMNKFGYTPDDVFILANSVRGGPDSPVVKLENEFVKKGIPCEVQMEDREITDERVIANKILFSTIHQAKGRERKLVIVLGIDNFHYNYVVNIKKREDAQQELINKYYVATTRASERLILVRNSTTEHLKLLPDGFEDNLEERFKFTYDVPKITNTTTNVKTNYRCVEILKHLTADVEQALFECIKFSHGPSGDKITYEPLIKGTLGQFEDVSDLYGVAITRRCELIVNSCIDYSGVVKNETKRKDIIALANKYKEKNPRGDNKEIVKMAEYEFVKRTALKSRATYTSGYDWVDSPAVDEAGHRVAAVIADETEPRFEVRDVITHHAYNQDYTIVGDADIITRDHVYEIKFTSRTSNTHIFQLALYGCMSMAAGRKLVLYNARTDTRTDVEVLDPYKFISTLIDFKNRSATYIDTPTFISRARDC